ncbi:hypothetical protein WJ96_05860 [Burkholderia ubonensis]|uniref:Uncharacterized protein n=1 Tax=Burkholderia ubonensis TaxID=101571 RepID=A0AAW3MT60_9BURK|nr:hypothetical protein [Burkholderia ubonensis]KVP75281.1 hypothetical protein WJ93_07655 [Burkholderia ubonensis]KVP96749.1 hypothetical protein WJ97_12785 [Burkholderia ubonensis]KVP98094.1 hypothetical protein WJ96_05860 [Burkholderia ubonensis]KVZ92791.1 hypothetical protein WL25_17520 [Burkholderia ubonensis]
MAHTLFVPPLGTRLVLVQPWDFKLYNEHRNATLMALLGDTRELDYDPKPVHATLPPGTELIVDRYYIKQGLGEFDSLSFRIAGVSATAKTSPWASKATKRQVRFWAKLEDVNTMRVELAPAKEA